MPAISSEKLKSFVVPPKSKDKIRIGLSHEFVELYRGDKDLKVGKLLCKDYNYEVIHIGTDIASPSDSHFLKYKEYPTHKLGYIPDNYYLLLMKSKLIYHRKGNVGMGGFFRFTPGIIRELKRWQPDLIFENPYLTLSPRSYMTYFVSRMLNIPLVYIDCGDIIHDLSLKHRIVLPFEKRVANNAAAVITYNKEGRKRFIKKYNYPSEKIYVIPKPIDTGRFRPDIDSREFRARYNLENKFTVAYFGRLCTNKGAEYLLYAADILRQRGLDKEICVLFVGGNVENGQSEDFKKHYEELKLKNVVLTGMIPNEDMPLAYSSVDAAIFPDVTNPPGFSTVLAESMASGLPIVIGINGWEDAMPIINGQTGLIIEHANPTQIADSIELLKSNNDLRGTISRNVLNYAREEMDYNRVVEKYVNIFNDLLGKNKPGKLDNYDQDFEYRTKELCQY